MAEILVVDDDQSVAVAFERFLRHERHECKVASNAEEAVQIISEHEPDLVVMDVRMPGVDGLQALNRIRGRFPNVYVVMMTAYGTSQTSIDAIRAGAFDYLTKPLDLDQLRNVIAQALSARTIRAQTSPNAPDTPEAEPLVGLVGESPAMQQVYKMIGRLATNDLPALIVGERGTGKQLVVATIHENSARRDQPFTTIDCATLPQAMIEQELFGSTGGTVHLAAVEQLPAAAQARLARAFGDGRTRTTGQGLSARVLASTESDLARQVQAAAFSRELYDALAVITLRLAPLRQRQQDIPLLVRHFVQRFSEELTRTIRVIDDRVSRRLQDHPWPGNVGELESVIKRTCLVTRSDVITMDDIGESLTDTSIPGRQEVEGALTRSLRTAFQERLVETRKGSQPSVFHDIVDLVETTLVQEALAITNGNQVKAAQILGVNRATLRKKISDGG